MRIAITGASGFLGQALVPNVAARGHELVLVGRSADALAQLFPDHSCTSYDALATSLEGCDALVHLAVKNNDADGSQADFQTVNVELLRTVLQACSDVGVPRVLLTSSLHAENPQKSAYASSKHDSEDLIEAWASIDGQHGTVLRLPAVYTDRFAGALSALNALPRIAQKFALNCAACLKPVVAAARVGEAVEAGLAQHTSFERLFIADGQRSNAVYAGLRRCIDILAGVCGLVLLSCFLVATWAVVKLTSKGPGLFIQTRVGRKREPFKCVKFRTMSVGTRNAASHEVGASTITKQGAVLRRYKIDELPQLWNVIMGTQSLVGPRPCLPSQDELIAARDHYGVFDVRPGITGWAQVQGVDMSQPERLATLDADYIARRTLILDAKILLATVLGRGSGDAASR